MLRSLTEAVEIGLIGFAVIAFSVISIQIF